MYLYYLQLHTAQGGLVCSFPAALMPQKELAQWQAQQSAVPAATGKKAASKTGKAPPKVDMADQCKAWYQEVTFAAHHMFTNFTKICGFMCLNVNSARS